jgi:hypothetical protein
LTIEARHRAASALASETQAAGHRLARLGGKLGRRLPRRQSQGNVELAFRRHSAGLETRRCERQHNGLRPGARLQGQCELRLLPDAGAADQTPEAECHEKAEDAYRALPKGTQVKSDNPHAVILDQAYFDRFSPVAVEQLALGGLHLAAVLNETLAADK